MEKNIKVIVWKTDGSYEGNSVYRLGNPDAGARFFADIECNAETDGRESFVIEMWDQAQWDKACRLVDEME